MQHAPAHAGKLEILAHQGQHQAISLRIDHAGRPDLDVDRVGLAGVKLLEEFLPELTNKVREMRGVAAK